MPAPDMYAVAPVASEPRSSADTLPPLSALMRDHGDLPGVRPIAAAHHDLLVAYDRLALRLAAATSALDDEGKQRHQRYLEQVLAGRRQAERAAVRHVRAVVGMGGGSDE